LGNKRTEKHVNNSMGLAGPNDIHFLQGGKTNDGLS
jgi:hypothetical protein